MSTDPSAAPDLAAILSHYALKWAKRYLDKTIVIYEDGSAWIRGLHSQEIVGYTAEYRKLESLLAVPPARPERDYKLLVQDVLEEYRDELTKEACDGCEQCGETVMCAFHSLLSALDGSTWTNGECRRNQRNPPAARAVPITLMDFPIRFDPTMPKDEWKLEPARPEPPAEPQHVIDVKCFHCGQLIAVFASLADRNSNEGKALVKRHFDSCAQHEYRHRTEAAEAQVQALQRRCDEFKRIGQDFERQFHDTFEQSCKNLQRAEAADARLRDLQIALTRYGQHSGHCQGRRGAPCTCGLKAVLASLPA